MQTARCTPKSAALLTITAILALLTGCASQPSSDEQTVQQDPRIEQARDAAAAGRSDEAIKLFEAAAGSASGSTADRLWLRAGLLRARQGDDTKARQALVRVEPQPANAQVAALRRLLAATLKPADEAEGAIEALADGPPDALPADIEEHWVASQAQALANAGRPIAAARKRVARQRLLTAGPLASANRDALWQNLSRIPLQALRAAVPAEKPDIFGGWLELAHAIRTNRLDPGAMREAIESWYARYPDHPARQTAYAEVVTERAIEQTQPPQQIAVLLPFTGRLAAVGRAVQNGIMAAYYQRGAEQRPELIIYDVGEAGRSPEAAYEDAIERGVDLVVGPLTKPGVEALARRSQRPVPILALNRVEFTEDLSGLFQFGLAPEDDAREAAQLMRGRGWHNAVVLAPDTDWGTRVMDAFSSAYTDGDNGGRILESARYRADEQDFSGPIRAVLNLDTSKARYQRLRRTLQRSLQFEPRRRRDVDAVFMPAFASQARLLKPQIRFHRGIGLPSVATSHAYGGVPDADRDDDLEGLIIVDTPWTLGAALPPGLAAIYDRATATWPRDARRQPRLMALGADAFRLTGPVDVLAQEPTLSLPGLTGRLSVERDGRIHRKLEAGQFQQGVVTPLLTGPDKRGPSSQGAQASNGDGPSR